MQKRFMQIGGAAVVLVALAIASMGQLNYPLSSEDKEIVKKSTQEFLPDLLFDAVWSKYFYYFEMPIVIDASQFLSQWSMSTSGSATMGGGRSSVVLKTGATSGSTAQLYKSPSIQNIFRWDRAQRFRSAFQIDNVSNVTGYLTVGDSTASIYYGFKISGNTLQGVVKNGGAEATTNLLTISAATTYDVEARFLPNEKVVFYVRSSSLDSFQELGVITSTLPSGTTHSDFASLYVTNSAAADKQLQISFIEYIQKR